MSDFSADRELSRVCTRLWELDENRLTPGKDYQIDLQGGRLHSIHDSISMV